MSVFRTYRMLKKSMKAIFWVITVVFIATIPAVFGPSWFGERRNPQAYYIAKINKYKIPRNDFETALQDLGKFKELQSGKELSPVEIGFAKVELLENIIRDRLIKEAERKERIRVSRRELESKFDQLVQKEIKESKKRYPKDKDWRKFWRSYLGTTQFSEKDLSDKIKSKKLKDQPDFLRILKEQTMLEKLRRKKCSVQVTVRDLYKKYAQVHAREILLKDKKKADEVYEKLKRGADFAALARQCSEDLKTAPQGGDLGILVPGQKPPAVEKVAFLLKPGEVSKPIKSSAGYHIIKVESRILNLPKDFQRNKLKYLREYRQEKELERWSKYLEELKKKAEIIIYDLEVKALKELSEAFEAERKGEKVKMQAKLEAAIKDLEKALEGEKETERIDPTLPFYLGMAYERKKELEKAIKYYEKAAEGTDFLELRWRLGNLYKDLYKKKKQKQYLERAVDNFVIASDLAYDEPMVHYLLEGIFRELNRPKELAREKQWIREYQKEQEARRAEEEE